MLSAEALAQFERNITEPGTIEGPTPDDLKRPEVVALMDSTLTLVQTLNDRDNLREEVAMLRQQLAAAESKCLELESTLEEATRQRDYFRSSFDETKEVMESMERLVARGTQLARSGYATRQVEKKMAMELPSATLLPEVNAGPGRISLSPKDDGKPIPSFLAKPVDVMGVPQGGKVMPLKGRPFGKR